MNRTWVWLTLVGCTVVHGAELSAQQGEDTVRLHDIVITATKLPTSLDHTGAAVSIITRSELRDRGLRRVIDALRTVPGVTVAQLGGTGAVASVFMRGGESDYVQVLVDGVQVNDPGGSFDWAHLTTDDVERIEVVRGPVSVLYGSDAVAGVVQIFTRGAMQRAARAHARLQVLGGRGTRVGALARGGYNAFDFNADAGGSSNLGRSTLSFAGTASRQQSDGAYAFNNEYDNRTFSGRVAATAARGEVGLTARYVDQTFHYPTSGSGAIVDHNKLTDGTSLALGASAGYWLGSRVDVRAQLASYRSRTGGSNPADEPGDGFDNSTADVQRHSAELRLNGRLTPTTTITGGAELERQNGSTTFDSDGPFGPFSSESSADRTNRALFAQIISSPVSALDVSAGVRTDDSDQFGRFTTGRAAASVRVWPALRLRAAAGSGFKEPTFLEAYATGFAVGDPELRPERSRSIEVGLEAGTTHSGMRAGVSLFDQRFRDLIQYTFAAAPGMPNYYNIGSARARGIETTLSATPSHFISFDAQYSYVDTNVDDDGFGEDRAFLEDRALLRRPAHQGSITALLAPAARLTATAALLYNGERDDLDFTDPVEYAGRRVRLPAHTTVDASATYELPTRRRATLTMRVSNLFDQRYDEVYNFPAAGRLVWFGAAIELGR